MEGEMPLQEMYYIAEMVVGVAVIISIVFVAIELRQNTRMMRNSMADGREQRFSGLWRPPLRIRRQSLSTED